MEDMMIEEKITSSALYAQGLIVSLPPPARHGTLLAAISFLGNHGMLATQGFLTTTGRFVNRVEAYEIAYRANQIISENKGPQLYSEDLY